MEDGAETEIEVKTNILEEETQAKPALVRKRWR